MSNAAFKLALAKIVDKAADKAEQATRLIALHVASAVVLRSPVDTGRFRANWQYGAATMDKSTTTSTDTGGTSTVGRIGGQLQSWKPGQTIYITNSLPYARALEYGHSKQAPGGMVRLAAVEFQQFAVKAIAGVKP